MLSVAVVVAAQIVSDAELDLPVAAGCVGGVLLGVYGVRRGWAGAANKLRFPTAALATVLVAALAVGTITDPVVIDGRVLSSSSKEARSVRLASQMSADLRTMAEYDDLLVADIADARAQVSAYEPAQRSLVSLSDKWSEYEDVPDPAFTAVVANLKTAAYWESEAMATKSALIQESDTRGESDLETQRASFTESWLAASSGLNGLGTALGIPISEHQEGPHE